MNPPEPWHDAHELAVANGEEGYFCPETGLFVLTSAFLRRRDECCQSGCRHCPFDSPGAAEDAVSSTPDS